MQIKINNPSIYTVGMNGLSIGTSLDIANDDQIKDIIRRCLLKESIIADGIFINRKTIKGVDNIKSAEELVEESK